MESDLIPAEQRAQIVDRLNPLLHPNDAALALEHERAESLADPKRSWDVQAVSALLAVIASLVGGLVSALPQLWHMSFSEIPRTFAVVAAASFIVIFVILILFRFRAAQEDLPSRDRQVNDLSNFERDVGRILAKYGAVESLSPDAGIDYVVKIGGKRLLVEAKFWGHPPRKAVLSIVGERLRRAAERVGPGELVVVTRRPVDAGDLGENIRFIAIRELPRFLDTLRSDNAAA
jgi:hypothetical protein